jgi:hypothetical protein
MVREVSVEMVVEVVVAVEVEGAAAVVGGVAGARWETNTACSRPEGSHDA